jgi:uncharacterized repeat protein (TIGR02543 family)
MTVYAKWTIIQYTITFNADGGSPATQTRTVNGGSSVGSSNMPADPAKSGYTFGGWYTARNGGGTQFTDSTVVSGNMTIYATWTIIQYTVTFNADGGSPATATRAVDSGSSVGSSNMPADPIKSIYGFGGWYTARNGGGTEFTFSTVVSGNMTVYARWTVLSFNDALAWINANAVGDGAYTITLTRDETITPKTLSYSGKNVSITIRGDAAKRTVNLSSSGNLFTVDSGVTLTLDHHILWRGRSDNNASLVRVNSEGKLVMNTGSEISGNTSSSYTGGGVHVSSGIFTMNGGTISGNSAQFGGGVYVGNIYVSRDTGWFTMNGGTISGNTSKYDGGGVYMYRGTFAMSGGTISGNTSQNRGGGVHIEVSCAFTMSNGTISGNTALYGGGVFVLGRFTMNGGEISSNTAAEHGGGVCVAEDEINPVTMNGGTISGNTAQRGGGVYVNSRGLHSKAFTKQSGGIIYGVDASTSLRNTATNGDDYGHAVYVFYGDGSKKRNTTAEVGITLDSAKDGPAWGWE